MACGHVRFMGTNESIYAKLHNKRCAPVHLQYTYMVRPKNVAMTTCFMQNIVLLS